MKLIFLWELGKVRIDAILLLRAIRSMGDRNGVQVSKGFIVEPDLFLFAYGELITSA